MRDKAIVLIVDDEFVNRQILTKMLSDDYDILEADNGRTALEMLKDRKNHISAVILDLIMPKFDGYFFLKLYCESERLKMIPVIVSTGDDSSESELSCLEMGAWDFIKKPYDVRIIKFRLRNAVERSELHLLKEMRYREQYDALTGLYKKEKFIEEMEEMLERNPEDKFVLIRLDIYKFQLINAFYGMDEGDGLLKKMADRLRCGAKKYKNKRYCHAEADVFYICRTYVSEENVIEEVSGIRQELNDYRSDYDIVPVFGIYVIQDRTIPISEMMDCANLASKKCKGNYMRNYSFYTEEMSESIVREQRIVNSMNTALEEEQFVLYLQPKYDLHNNEIDGAEVLVRWKSPEKGMISPGDFIPVFERNGFIMKLDFYVWDHACQLIRKWLDEGRKPYPISVNISRVSLYNPNLVNIIVGLIEKYELSASMLQLELTESAYTSNPMAIKEALEKLQKRGFAILMDDFGSGYSSLNVLKDIAVDILKIDMKFMSDCDMPGRSENILASVVRMAKWLNMPVIAEGVEKEEQVNFLRGIGCEYVQGYYFAKPMPIEDYEKRAFGGSAFHASSSKGEMGNVDSLWTSTSQMEMLFSNMLQAVVVYEYDANGVDIIRVNDAYYDLFGYKDLDSYNKYFLNNVEEVYKKDIHHAFEEAVRTEGVAECEFMRCLEKGRTIWINMKLKYVSLVGKKHVIFGLLNDITTQKEVDKELQKYRTAISSTRTGMKTILIVDDVEINRGALAAVFEDDYNLLEAENGQDALDLLTRYPEAVDLILLDVVMPVMDGTTFLEYKNGNPNISDIPVVIITSDDSRSQQIHTLEMGANDYIVKPFVPEVVLRRISNVLESTQRVGEALKNVKD